MENYVRKYVCSMYLLVCICVVYIAVYALEFQVDVHDVHLRSTEYSRFDLERNSFHVSLA